MYLIPFDLAHSSQIDASGGRAAILGFILCRLPGCFWVVELFLDTLALAHNWGLRKRSVGNGEMRRLSGQFFFPPYF
jgi:hypothetical protein